MGENRSAMLFCVEVEIRWGTIWVSLFDTDKVDFEALITLFLIFFISLSRGPNRNRVKDEKFGFGGKKRGMKRNDKSSADDISGYKQPRKAGGKFAGKKGGKPGKKRPGQGKRQKMKSGGKK